jgi:hypothetical protein
MKVAWMIPLAALLWQPRAHACGCFTMPSVATPVVQAGERILFAHDGTNVIAYIQIQYQGSADQFGWLVPVPSIPTLTLGTDELFTLLGKSTQPTFTLTTTNICTGTTYRSTSGGSGIGCGLSEDNSPGYYAAQDLGITPDLGQMHMNEVVVQSSIGPYDYAVLRADDQTEMSKWLSDNGYFVPDATGQAVKPYIHPGGFFLALKLRADQSTNDITPIVLKYQSDLPMIPITLTQVGAVPDMGILVWVLGSARAIPRNYRHTVLDEMPIWMGGVYQQQVISAVREAPGRHSFITEYAGSSNVMSRLVYSGRFGDLTHMRTLSDPAGYIDYLKSHGYTFDSVLYALLQRFIPMPEGAIAAQIPVNIFYDNYSYYETRYVVDGGVGFVFDPIGLTDAIEMRIVTPTKDAQNLFDTRPYLTRLYTTISPEDMNLDPVFSENPDLPQFSLNHSATLTIPCNRQAWLTTDQGLEVQYPNAAAPAINNLPPTLRLETLREAGQPLVDTDNTDLVKQKLGSVNKDTSSNNSMPSSSSSNSGCACDTSARGRNQIGTGVLVLLAIAGLRLRRSPRKSR